VGEYEAQKKRKMFALTSPLISSSLSDPMLMIFVSSNEKCWRLNAAAIECEDWKCIVSYHCAAMGKCRKIVFGTAINMVPLQYVIGIRMPHVKDFFAEYDLPTIFNP
jgi:hypothetical protein